MLSSNFFIKQYVEVKCIESHAEFVSDLTQQPKSIFCSRFRNVCFATARPPVRTVELGSSAHMTNVPPASTSPAPKSPESS